ncbi:MADS-box transcription factor PHERES 1 [Forsythia ovata]|uniref:MADS-box transcription factor PHERES 1 n=1 Tax=Forsythia ovata TaxID=205694 RepID=A0ABD1SRX1_9LAMI
MTRRKVKRVKIDKVSRRNNVLRNRTDGLLKKASELSILSGADIGIVIHKPEQNNTTLWPSPDDFRARLHKFFDFPEMERERKMVVHDKYLVKRVEEETEKLRNIQRRNDSRECENVMNELIEGKNVYGLDLNQLNVLFSIAAEKVKELETREEELDEQDALILNLAPPILPFEMVAINQAIEIEDLRTDQWFIETKFDGQINPDYPRTK